MIDTRPLKPVYSYLYYQYKDDLDLQAFINAFNEMAQGYWEWYRDTPLSVYSNTNVFGSLLDWVGLGLYGLGRPILLYAGPSRNFGEINSCKLNWTSINGLYRFKTGKAVPVTDDVYKRVLTWFLYRGDGYEVTLDWLRKRIARFLFGPNGSDITNDYLQEVSLQGSTKTKDGAINSYPINSRATNSSPKKKAPVQNVIVITLQDSIMSQQFQQLLNQGWLSVPFEITFTVNLT